MIKSKLAGEDLQSIVSPRLFEHFLYGLALVGKGGDILRLNRKARELLVPSHQASGRSAWTCCDLICDHLNSVAEDGCMATRAVASDSPLPEVRIDIEGCSQAAAWVTASSLDAEGTQLLFHLRPGRLGDRRRQARPEWSERASVEHRELRITALGEFKVEDNSGPVTGEWLEQRPGQLLKYLVCERHHPVTSDRIAEALWPGTTPEEGRNRLRYYVHALREKLEPNRAKRSPSRFVAARRGSYALDLSRVQIDTDDFERNACAGLTAFVHGQTEPATVHLDRALSLYGDGFLSGDPYEEWTLGERERLHELAGRALRAQIRIRLRLDDVDEAAAYARRLADLEPFDTEVHRLLIDICLRRGRHSEAVRRYAVLRKRMLSSFGEEPDFALAELKGLRDEATA